ncbi:MAG: glycosyltransferase [Gammaproteobacteria bacterium]|nr:glycosyltransferase [Gammaproteobacteria bacterium]
MRIATVTTFFPNAADPQRAVFVANLVSAMRRIHDVDVIAPVPYVPPWLRVARWSPLRRIPRREWIGNIEVEHPRFVAVPRAGSLSGLTYALAILPSLRRLRKFSRQLIVHAHCAFPDGVGVAFAARRLGMPYVITAHGSDINVYANSAPVRAQLRRAFSGASAVIAVSDKMRTKILDLDLLPEHRDPKCVVHIPCAGFDPGIFFPRPRSALRRELSLDLSGRIVVFAGELVAIKGVDTLIEAWRQLCSRARIDSRDRLIVLGAGRCRSELERQAMSSGIHDRVLFLGAQPHAAVSRWIGAADLLCLPSRNEGTPNVVVEALASGVPVVATRVGGLPELVTHRENGLLVEPNHADALAEAIVTAFSQAWAPDHVRLSVAHLTWDAIAARNGRCLNEALQGGSHVAMA